MALRGATVITVPAAFTAVTGPSHWELLLRARAVENQVYVIGAAQVGRLPAGMPRCHGHSMIVDPWGTVLAERTDPSPGVVLADLDADRQSTESALSCRCWLTAAPTPTVGRMTKPGARLNQARRTSHRARAPGKSDAGG